VWQSLLKKGYDSKRYVFSNDDDDFYYRKDKRFALKYTNAFLIKIQHLPGIAESVTYWTR
jgi:hypothetical protein